MLFADAIVLINTDPISLQSQIANKYQYSSRWGLKINVEKIKIGIYEKRKENYGT